LVWIFSNHMSIVSLLKRSKRKAYSVVRGFMAHDRCALPEDVKDLITIPSCLVPIGERNVLTATRENALHEIRHLFSYLSAQTFC
jgi:hypothetical protein